MALINQDSRLLMKRSNIAGVIPTIPTYGGTNHTERDEYGSSYWIDTDLYEGELFINTVDEKVWYRSDNNILQIYPPLSGGTLSQDVFYYETYPAFSATTGAVDKLYIAKDTHISYLWNATYSSYEVIGTNATVYWNSIVDRPSGSTSSIDAAITASHSVNDLNINYLTSGETDLRYVLQVDGSGLTSNNFTDYYKGLLDTGYVTISFVNDLIELPITGVTDKLYIVKNDLSEYLWDSILSEYVVLQSTDPTPNTIQPDVASETDTNERFYLLMGHNSGGTIENYNAAGYIPNRILTTVYSGTTIVMSSKIYDSKDFFEFKYHLSGNLGTRIGSIFVMPASSSSSTFTDIGPSEIGDTSSFSFSFNNTGSVLEMKANCSDIWNLVIHRIAYRSGVYE